VAITGCTLQHGREGKDSANIRVLGQSLPYKEMPVRQGHVTISGNVLSDVQVNVHLQGCRGVTVVGNTFWEGFAHNLLVEESHSVVVGPNNMDRNPHYDRYGKSKEARNLVVFRDCEACTVSGLHIVNVRGGPGMLLKGCRRMNLSGCTVLDCEPGVVLEDSSDCLLTGFLVRGNAAKAMSLTVKGGKGNRVAASVWADGMSVEEGAATVGP
jgi:parallel beta-helix repeat protein